MLELHLGVFEAFAKLSVHELREDWDGQGLVGAQRVGGGGGRRGEQKSRLAYVFG